ncbi:MAG: hypothetical protein HRU75_14730 [Planctomycetia bacterium]|nr:MAG: hypothetical protein HRU75_14730 [Planctomycetia bacterium]
MTTSRASVSPARALAVRAVTAVLSDGGRLSEALAQGSAERAGIDARDAGLARELAFGAVRRLGTIEGVLSRFAAYEPRRTPAALRAVLLTAGYQLLYLDRVPAFAAVHEAVSVARRLRGAPSSRMVNAVLRRVTDAVVQHGAKWDAAHPAAIRTGWDSATILREPLIHGAGREDDQRRRRRLAIQTGESLARLSLLIQRFGDERGVAAAWAGQGTPPTVLHRNSLRATREEFAARAADEHGVGAREAVVWAADPDGEAVLFVPPGVRVAESALLREGLAYVQDLTAADAARLLRAQPGEHVLDLCAAPGGKSVALALRGARVLACDASAPRLERLRENARRLGLDLPVCVTPAGGESAAIGAAREGGAAIIHAPLDVSVAEQCAGGGEFDAAIVDAPCSNSGVLARRPEARLRLCAAALRSLFELQVRLLGVAAACVRGGGRIVYSTCSIEEEENDRVVEAFVRLDPRWRCAERRLTLPTWGACASDWRDGGFAALLVDGHSR